SSSGRRRNIRHDDRRQGLGYMGIPVDTGVRSDRVQVQGTESEGEGQVSLVIEVHNSQLKHIERASPWRGLARPHNLGNRSVFAGEKNPLVAVNRQRQI